MPEPEKPSIRRKTVGIVKAGWNFADNLDVIVLITTLAAFLTYPLLWRPREVLLDDMAEWGMKGPGTPSLSENMRGVYYLSGAKQTSRCNATEQRTNCVRRLPPPVGLRVRHIVLQTLVLVHDVSVRHGPSPLGPFLLTSAHSTAATTPSPPSCRHAPLLHLDKADPEFAGRDADWLGDLAEGLGIPVTWLPAKPRTASPLRTLRYGSRSPGDLVGRHEHAAGEESRGERVDVHDEARDDANGKIDRTSSTR